MLLWLYLLLCLIVIGYAGYFLSRYGDIIAEKPCAPASMMSALVIVGLVFRPQGRTMPGLTWISLGLFLLYILNTWVLFQHGQ